MTRKIPKRLKRPGVDRLGRTPLHNAAIANDAALVRELLAAGASPSPADDNRWTPLHFAAQAQDIDTCRALIEAGAPIDAEDSNGNTPLSNAVFTSRGQGAVISPLRRSGANPHQPNHYGVSALSLAREIANFDVRQYFADLLE